MNINSFSFQENKCRKRATTIPTDGCDKRREGDKATKKYIVLVGRNCISFANFILAGGQSLLDRFDECFGLGETTCRL